MTKKKIIIIISIITLIIVSIVSLFIVSNKITESNTKEVPDVIGLEENNAVAALEEAGFTVEVEYVYSKIYDNGKAAKLATSFSSTETGWSASWLAKEKYDCKKKLYVIVSKGPSGYITKKYDSHIEVNYDGNGGFSGGYNLVIDYEQEERYFYLSIKRLEPKAVFDDSGQAVFESDITSSITCDYVYYISHGEEIIKLVFPQSAFADALPKKLKYTLDCTVSNKSYTFTIEFDNIEWEKNDKNSI